MNRGTVAPFGPPLQRVQTNAPELAPQVRKATGTQMAGAFISHLGEKDFPTLVAANPITSWKTADPKGKKTAAKSAPKKTTAQLRQAEAAKLRNLAKEILVKNKDDVRTLKLVLLTKSNRRIGFGPRTIADAVCKQMQPMSEGLKTRPVEAVKHDPCGVFYLQFCVGAWQRIAKDWDVKYLEKTWNLGGLSSWNITTPQDSAVKGMTPLVISGSLF